MSDFFRVLTGIDIDSAVQVLHGSTTPGVSPTTVAAPVGSLYLNTINGTASTKTSLGLGNSDWTVLVGRSSLLLYTESTITPTPPAALGVNSIALGSGAQTSIAASTSLAIGDQSLARIPGCVVQASGRFSSSGDAQVGRYLVRTTTTNGVLTPTFVDGTNGTQQLIIPDNSTWMFTATVVGHQTSAMGGHAGYKIEGVVYRDSGVSTVSILGKATTTVLAESNTPWDATATVDVNTGALVVSVRGESSKIIRWLAIVETVEITN
jgi:hypothetical protein